MGIHSSAGDFISPQSLILLAIISSISIYAIIIFFYSEKNSSKKKKKKPTWYPPGMQPYPIIGHLPQFLRHRRRFLDWSTDFLAASPSNTIVFRRPGGTCDVITANPANVEHMLKSRFDNYPKGPSFRENLHDFLGRGIFNSDGPHWRLQRKIASLEFNTRSLRSFIHRVVSHETSARLLPCLRRAVASGETLDLQDALECFALDNVCKVSFDADPALLDPSVTSAGCLARGFAAAFRDAAQLSSGRFLYAVPQLWKVKKLLDAGCERRLRESIDTVHEFAMQIIRSRKKDKNIRGGGGRGGDDLLSRFIDVGENNSDEFLRDIIISFLLAGTSSSGLSWFFWLLSSRPDVERRILAEIADVRARAAGNSLGLDELRQMHYLHAAVTESMRLYPPVPFNLTTCCADEVLPDGTEIKKGTLMSFNAYAMGRMEKIWGKDCLEYRPDRWLDGSGEFTPESPFRFPAFGGGPRVCLGKEMAYAQMKSIVACVLEGFELEVLSDKNTCPEHLLSLTLRMRGGLPVRVKERRREVEIE